jgi:NDP-sugar pyrophosphorylase family protein
MSNADDSMNVLTDTTAILLVGGQGTRLRTVISSTPKPLARVGKQPFLELLVRQLQRQGVRRLVMCTGYMSSQIEEEFGDGRAWGLEVTYSRESQPMGTGGALKLAKPFIADEQNLVVMNGDSFLDVNLASLVEFHRERKGIASFAVVRVPDAARYGTVEVGAHVRVTGFLEKTGANLPGVINAGVYVFDREIFEHIADGPASLEKDVFPKILTRRVYALEVDGMFIDIGTPEDYARAQTLFDRLSHAAVGDK